MMDPDSVNRLKEKLLPPGTTLAEAPADWQGLTPREARELAMAGMADRERTVETRPTPSGVTDCDGEGPVRMEELTERLAVSSVEVTIEGWHASGVPMVGIYVDGEPVAECTADIARFFACRLVSLPAAPALGRETTDTLAHELLAVCDALTQ